MKKVVVGGEVYFYNDNDCEIMMIDHSTDECIWYFHSNEEVHITKDMELYSLLESFMNNEYEFSNDVLLNRKDQNKLIWYSDCYYNPDDEWSVASVSKLTIERTEFGFKIYCSRKLDDMLNRAHRIYGICFSPCGNGKYSKNKQTGLTLQDDFVLTIYQPLLKKNMVLKKV